MPDEEEVLDDEIEEDIFMDCKVVNPSGMSTDILGH